MMRPSKDLKGRKFGRLTVIEFDHKNEKSYPFWKCKCSCGKDRIVMAYSLINGRTKSCGCLSLELRVKARTTHGATRGKVGDKKDHPTLYGVWTAMKARCNNKNTKAYKNYGGRGIKICSTWNNSFPAFNKWCKENGYEKGLQIDRKRNNKNYTPSNCRFVSPKVNGNNRRNNKIIEFNQEKHTVSEWANKLDIKTNTLWMRLYVYNYPLEKAMTSNIYSTNGIVVKKS